MVGSVTVGTEVPPIVKSISQEKINLFEGVGIHGQRSNIHTDMDAAKRTIGLTTPIASGRVQLSFVTDAQRRFFGGEVFDRSGTVDLRFVKPVIDGDTITVKGKVISVDDTSDGQAVAVDVWCENQNGERTSMGTATAVLPKK